VADLLLGIKIGATGGPQTVREIKKINDEVVKLQEQNKRVANTAKALQDAYNLSDAEIKQITNELLKLEKTTGAVSGKAQGLNSALAGLASAGAFAAIQAVTGAVRSLGQAIVGFAGQTLQVGGAAEQAEVAFTTMLGSADAAKATLSDLSDFAATTPFELPQVRAAGQQLIAFGFEQENLIETLRRVGDVSAGVNTDFGELATIYGKARVQGRLFAEDINQLTERGIPIIGELAAQFGVSESKVRDLVSAGKVGFDELEQAFISLTAEGGRFGGLMAAQSQTIPGIVSNIADSFTRFQESVFKAFQPLTSGLLQEFTEILANVGENFDGFDAITDASERLQGVLEGNPEIAEELGAAFATLANEAVDQFAQIIDAVTAFIAEEGNIEQIAGQIESLATVIQAIGGTIQFLIGLADGLTQLVNSAEGLPVVGDNIDRFLKFPSTINLVTEAMRGLMEMFGLLPVAVGQAIDTIGEFIPLLEPLLAQIDKLIEGVGAIGGADAAGLNQLKEGAGLSKEAIDNLGGAFNNLQQAATTLNDQKAALPGPSEEEAEAVEDRLKKLADANNAALEKIETDNKNLIASRLEEGASAEDVAALEETALKDRVNQNKKYLDQLKAIQSGGGLSEEEAASVANAIQQIESDLASDRVAIAQSYVAAQEAAEKARIEAAEEAADKIVEQIERERDTARETAQAQFDAGQEAQSDAFENRQRAAEDSFNDQQRAKEAAFQDSQQAAEDAFNSQQQAAEDAFNSQQQAAQDAFNNQQQAKQRAFQKQLDAERDQGNREFDVLTDEVERRVQLEAAADEEQRRALKEQFKLEDQQLEKRRKIESEVLGQRGSVLSQRSDEVALSPLEQARQDFEEKLQARSEEFEQAQQEQQRQFEEQQRLDEEEFRSGQEELERQFDEEQRQLEQAFEQEQQQLERAFKDEQRQLERTFDQEQQAAEAAFKAQQRQLDLQTAQQVKNILESAKQGIAPTPRRLGGPIQPGQPYLVGEEGPELIYPSRAGYVATARQTTALMGNPAIAGTLSNNTGRLEAQLDTLIREVRRGRRVAQSPTYHLTTAQPIQDMAALQLEQIRKLSRGRAF
jgi:tape measure domain-containing protein